jgi:thioredoxin-like negative regulator of GroEL
MAPVVHGLEKNYAGKVQFLYLDTSDPRTLTARKRLGFGATPHFFFLRADGSEHADFQGVVPEDSVRRSVDRLLASSK